MVSIVMPAYNEHDIIGATVDEWHGEVVSKLPGAELIVVDDCSKDATSDILAERARRIPQLRVVRPARNGGHGKALRLGFEQSRNEFIFQTDSDRQHIPAQFWTLWQARDNCDFVFGVRSTREDGGFRVLVTRTMRLLNLVTWQLWINDANCPFKLMRTSALRTVLERVPGDSFIPMVMVSILARKLRFRYCEVRVTHLPRKGGQQSLKGVFKWVRVGATCFGQLFRLRISVLGCRPGSAERVPAPETLSR